MNMVIGTAFNLDNKIVPPRAAYRYQANHKKYMSGQAGYEEYMGDKAQFAQGYRSGFRTGYTDAFYGSRGRFATLGRRFHLVESQGESITA